MTLLTQNPHQYPTPTSAYVYGNSPNQPNHGSPPPETEFTPDELTRLQDAATDIETAVRDRLASPFTVVSELQQNADGTDALVVTQPPGSRPFASVITPSKEEFEGEGPLIDAEEHEEIVGEIVATAVVQARQAAAEDADAEPAS